MNSVLDYIVTSKTSIIVSIAILAIAFWLSKREGQSHVDKAIYSKIFWYLAVGLLSLQIYFIYDSSTKPSFTKSQPSFEAPKRLN
jgi:hypothetical protein